MYTESNACQCHLKSQNLYVIYQTVWPYNPFLTQSQGGGENAGSWNSVKTQLDPVAIKVFEMPSNSYCFMDIICFRMQLIY